MIDRLRELFGRGLGSPTGQRHVTRREREEFHRRLAVIGIAIAAIALVGILATGAIYQYVYLPGQTLATVDGVKITRSDYWKVRKIDLLSQIQQYSQLAQLTTGQQAQQYQQLAAQADASLRTVSSDPVDPTTLNQMVESQVVLQRMGTLGLSVTDEEVEQTLADFFSPVPLASPTPTLGIDPTAEAWATATAQAAAAASATAAAEAEAEATPSPEAATPTAEATESPGTPEAEATPEATPTPTPSPTPNPEEARATATATYNSYKQNVLDRAGMSLDDFKRLIVRPQVAIEKVQYELASQIPTRAEQVHAAHILVATEDAAKVIEQELADGADFAELAEEKSADTGTAPNGGDLGWFPRGMMVKEFEDVAFSLSPGEISQPVQTQFGWHIIKVIDHEQDRPVDETTLQNLRGSAFAKWLEAERAQVTISSDITLTTPTPEPQFTPPPDAPPTPTPTPTPTPEATPEPTATP